MTKQSTGYCLHLQRHHVVELIPQTHQILGDNQRVGDVDVAIGPGGATPQIMS